MEMFFPHSEPDLYSWSDLKCQAPQLNHRWTLNNATVNENITSARAALNSREGQMDPDIKFITLYQQTERAGLHQKK